VPRLLLFAGPNGSGKSTVTTPETLDYYDIPSERYINADDIARTLAGMQAERTQAEREHIAFVQARELRQTYREEGLSFAFETVFSHPSTLMDIQRCRVGRVAGRYQAGGHDSGLKRTDPYYPPPSPNLSA
jgi:predicted ABC-type ATPase